MAGGNGPHSATARLALQALPLRGRIRRSLTRQGSPEGPSFRSGSEANRHRRDARSMTTTRTRAPAPLTNLKPSLATASSSPATRPKPARTVA